MSAATSGRARRGAIGSAVALWAALALAAWPALADKPAERPARADSAEAPTVVTPGARPHRVIAYYFHTTQRCASCRAIEAYAKEAVETAFAKELKDGRLVWRTVNLDVKGNEHFVKDYRLYTKSVILVNEQRGRAPEWKNLEKVWQLLRDKEAFLRYVQGETRAYLATERS